MGSDDGQKRRGATWLEYLAVSRQQVRIVLVTAGLAMGYGVVHDQITAHLCTEYFSVFHPRLFRTESPALLGLAWGVAATFWPGIVFGVLLGRASQSEGRPPISLTVIRSRLFSLLAIMAMTSLAGGVLGFQLWKYSLVMLPQEWGNLLPEALHGRFMAVWFAHAASYVVGVVGATRMIFKIWNARKRPRIITVLPGSWAAVVRLLVLLFGLGVLVCWRLAS